MTIKDPDRRNKIIEVARIIFSQHGYDGTSISMIASGAKLTKAALYHHFTSKEDIFRASSMAGINELINEVEITLNNAGSDPLDRLRAFLVATANRFNTKQDSWEIGAALFWEVQVPNPRHDIVQRRDYYENLLKSLLKDCVDYKIFREDIDISLTSKFLMSVINQLPRWYRKEGKYTAIEIVSIFLDTLVSGIRRSTGVVA